MDYVHFHVSRVQASRGQSVVAAAAYAAGLRLRDQQTGRLYDFRRRTDVIASRVLLPPDVPAMGSEALWNLAHRAERRWDACLAQKIVAALPAELPVEGQLAIALVFGQELVAGYACAVELAVHAPHRAVGDSRPQNVHAHYLVSTRAISGNGFSKTKLRELDALATRRVHLRRWREIWAARINDMLRNFSLEAGVDYRSHRDRNLTQRPRGYDGRGGDERRPD
jgi:ATP-dependent exoDNAse (exonuclease V) alpha subunit